MHDIQSKDIQTESLRRKTLQMKFASAQVPALSSIQTDTGLMREGENVDSPSTIEDTYRDSLESPGTTKDESQRKRETSATAKMGTQFTDADTSEGNTRDEDGKKVLTPCDHGELREEETKTITVTEKKLTDMQPISSTPAIIGEVLGTNIVQNPDLPVHPGVICVVCKVYLSLPHTFLKILYSLVLSDNVEWHRY